MKSFTQNSNNNNRPNSSNLLHRRTEPILGSSTPIYEPNMISDFKDSALYFKSNTRKKTIERVKNTFKSSKTLDLDIIDYTPNKAKMNSSKSFSIVSSCVLIPYDPLEDFDKEYRIPKIKISNDEAKNIFLVTKNPLASLYNLNLVRESKMLNISSFFLPINPEKNSQEPTYITVTRCFYHLKF